MPRSALDPQSVIGKVAAITEAVAASEGVMGLSEVARRSGVAKPSTHRLLNDLVTWGIIERQGDGYRLGARLYDLGLQVPARRRLRDTALPFMEDLYVATGHTVHLAVLDVDELLYVEKIAGHKSVATPSKVAGRMPLHCTATGKIFLAYTEPSLFEMIVDHGLERRTARTIADPVVLATELETVRADGVAVEHEELREGFSSVAVPLFGPRGAVAAALALTTAAELLELSRCADLLRRAATGISRRLGWTPE